MNHDDLSFVFYVKKRYVAEMMYHVAGLEDRIKIGSLMDRKKWERRTKSKSINSWYGSKKLETGVKKGVYLLNERYFEFFTKLSEDIGVPCPFKDSNGILMNNPTILERAHPDIPEDFDILLINSAAYSNQYRQPARFFDEFIEQLKDQYKIITTRSPADQSIPCTLDYGLNLLQIGNISTKVKYVVAVATSPIIPSFNVWSIETVKKWAVLSNRSSYTYRDNITRFNKVQHVLSTGFLENT
jgi:hypothetical protein